MTQIIPRDLIKHLEWAPGKEQPKPQQTTQSQPSQQTQGNLQVKTDFSKYIQVGMSGLNRSPVVISPFELENFNDMNYDNTHVKLLENGLYMPTPSIFMTHFNNVIQAFNRNKKLNYADGTEVPNSLVNEMYEHMTTNSKNVYGRSDVGAWTWLNAKFVDGNGFNGLALENVVGLTSDKKFGVKKTDLSDYVDEDCYVDLSFNSQGLADPTSKSGDQSYNKGSNIYFWHPRKNQVARFVANSGRAYLVCDGDPSVSSDALGVFGCAEGTPRAGKGGSR